MSTTFSTCPQRYKNGRFYLSLAAAILLLARTPVAAQAPGDKSHAYGRATADGSTDSRNAAQVAPASISGRVFDQQGAVIETTVVTLTYKASGLERTATTGATGAFRFDNVAAGRSRISARALGFSITSEDVAVSPGEESKLDLTLQPGTIAEQVTVTATRTRSLADETPVPLGVVSRQEIERRAVNTIGDLFRDLLGVGTVNEGPFQVRPRIRGLDSNRVLILVDGERLNNARTSTSNSGIEAGLVDVDQIESVEMARGSGSVLYGTDALAGTINIITSDSPARRESGLRIGGGVNGFFTSNGTGRRGSSYVTGASQRFSFRIAQTLDRFDNYHSGAVPQTGGVKNNRSQATEVLNSGYHGSNTQLVGRFFISKSQSVRTVYERRRALNIGVPGLVGVFTAFFPYSNRDKLSARYEGQNLAQNLARLSLSAYYQKQDRNFSNVLNVPAAPPFFPGTFQFSETLTKVATIGLDAQSNWTLGQHNVLTAGASYARDRNRDSRFILRLTPNFSTIPPSLTPSEDRSKSVPNAVFRNLAFFAQDEYEVTKKIRLLGGVRLDCFNINSERTSGFSSPSFFTQAQLEDLALTSLDTGLNIRKASLTGDLGVVFKPNESIRLTARIGRSFREPNLFERFFTDFGSAAGFVVGNPNLKAESGVTIDTDVKVRTARFAGSFTYFNNTYSNFLTSKPALDRNGTPIIIPSGPGRPPTPVFQTLNTDRARIQGTEGEFEFSWHVAESFLTPIANVSYLRGEDPQRHVPLDFITPLKTVFGLRWQDGRERFWSEYRVRLVNKQPRLSPQFLLQNGGAEPGFVTHDVRGGVNLKRETYTIGLTGAVENLANRFYSEQFVRAPARGRSAMLGIRLRFF